MAYFYFTSPYFIIYIIFFTDIFVFLHSNEKSISCMQVKMILCLPIYIIHTVYFLGYVKLAEHPVFISSGLRTNRESTSVKYITRPA